MGRYLSLEIKSDFTGKYPQEFGVKSNSKNISWDTQNENCFTNAKYTDVFKIIYSDAPDLILFATAKGMAFSCYWEDLFLLV